MWWLTIKAAITSPQQRHKEHTLQAHIKKSLQNGFVNITAQIRRQYIHKTFDDDDDDDDGVRCVVWMYLNCRSDTCAKYV